MENWVLIDHTEVGEIGCESFLSESPNTNIFTLFSRAK